MSRAGADRSGRTDPDAPDRRGDRDREPRSFDFDWRTAAFLGLTRQRVDEEIKRIVGDAHGRTVRLLSENRHRLETLAEDLFLAETLDAPDAYAAAGIDWPAGRAMEREESVRRCPRRHGSKFLMLSPAMAPRITPRSAP